MQPPRLVRPSLHVGQGGELRGAQHDQLLERFAAAALREQKPAAQQPGVGQVRLEAQAPGVLLHFIEGAVGLSGLIIREVAPRDPIHQGESILL